MGSYFLTVDFAVSPANSSFSRPTAIFGWWAKCTGMQRNALLENTFCPPGTDECACAALRNKMADGRKNDE
jgi:hypothetical protein